MTVSRARLLAALAAAVLALQACSDNSSQEAEKDKSAGPPKAAEGVSGQRPEATGPGPARQAARRLDACSLLTLAEVEAVLGDTMEGPTTGHSAGGGVGEGSMTSCSFATKSGSENAAPAELLAELQDSWYVTIIVWSWPVPQGAINYVTAMRDAPMRNEPVRDVPGLGEEAVWNGTLHVRKGRISLSLDVAPPKADASKVDEMEMELALLKTAMGRVH